MAMMRRKQRPTGEIPTASMADIAFLLLIFFLVSTVFDEEKGLQLVLPQANSQVEVSADDILFLRVQADGQVQVRRGAEEAVQSVRPDQVASLWRGEVERNRELVAAVQTAPDAPYRLMVDVLDQLQLAGATKISLQAQEPD